MNGETTLPYETHSEGSKAAAKRVAPVAPTMRERVYHYISRHPRVCDQAIALALAMNLKTVNARRRELEEVGLVRPAGLTKSPKGATTGAWVCTSEPYPKPFPRVHFTAAKRRAETPTAAEFNEASEIMRIAYRTIPRDLWTDGAIKVMRWIAKQS